MVLVKGPGSPSGELMDAAGVSHSPVAEDARIVSLVPSLTELLFDLGLAEAIVGRTTYCSHPAAAASVPSVGGTKKINMEKLRALGPTHVIVNVDETPVSLAEEIAGVGIRVIVTHPLRAADNVPLIKLIGGVFGACDRAAELSGDFTRAYDALEHGAADFPERRVLYLIWKDPWMTVSRNTYISDVLGLVRWRTLGHSETERYPEVTLSDDILNAADLVLFSSEPFPFASEHLRNFDKDFPRHAGKGRLIDAEMVSWYGSRAARGMTYVRDLAEGLST